MSHYNPIFLFLELIILLLNSLYTYGCALRALSIHCLASNLTPTGAADASLE